MAMNKPKIDKGAIVSEVLGMSCIDDNAKAFILSFLDVLSNENKVAEAIDKDIEASDDDSSNAPLPTKGKGFITNLFDDDETYVTANKAMTLLSLSRHTFKKLVEEKALTGHPKEKHTYYKLSDLLQFQASDRFAKLKEGTFDPRNKLNDLTGKDWLPETKSYFFQKGLGQSHPEAQIEILHPAPYSFQDIEKLILFFTKKGAKVLDPFGGVASTAKACERCGRTCTSIELSPEFHELSLKRLETECGEGTSNNHVFINGDSSQILPTIENATFDFIVTSPPYWGILNKQDQKVKKNRVANNLATKYSEDDKDLGNVENYSEFISILCNKIFLQCARVLKKDKYMAIVISDFRDNSEFISFHSDLIQKLNKTKIPGGGKLLLQGTKILIQNHKSLLPYGYPFSYVENIHHQYVLIFKKGK